MNDAYIFVPSRDLIVRIAEGTGDNLDRQDLAEGYVDYIYYEQYSLKQDFPEVDGGMILKKAYLQDTYKDLFETAPEVLDMAYSTKDISYVRLAA